MKVFIINPDNGKPVSIEEWRKDQDPTRAQLLGIETDEGRTILTSKSYLPGSYNFQEAQKACEEFTTPKLASSGLIFRAPTRKESIDLYDARFQGLNEAVKLTGGDFATKSRTHWTCERDADPRYGASGAWYSHGLSGFAGSGGMYGTIGALPVALLK